MSNFQTHIKHGGGTHNVDVEVEGDRALITFGSSFTLRLDAQSHSDTIPLSSPM